jgi:hypothetical protein
VLPTVDDIFEYYQRLLKEGEIDYWLPVRFQTIAAGATATPLTIRVTGGFRFTWLALVGTCDLSSYVRIKLTDNQPGQPLMNDFVSVANLVGTGAQPALLFSKRVLESNQTITVEAKNVHGSTDANVVEIVLRGVLSLTQGANAAQV